MTSGPVGMRGCVVSAVELGHKLVVGGEAFVTALELPGNAWTLQPAGQLSPKGVLLARHVKGRCLAGGPVQSEPRWRSL